MRLWERFKAWRRGEVMLPGVSRGRCFINKDPEKKDLIGPMRTTVKSSAKLIGIRVIRTNGDIEERL